MCKCRAQLPKDCVDVVTSQEYGTREAEDEKLLARASAAGRLLFTQDEDFLHLASEWRNRGQNFVGIVFARQMGASLGRMIEDLELLVLCATDDELNDQVTYLPLA